MNPFIEIIYAFFLSPVYFIHTLFRKLSLKQKLIRLLFLILSPSTWAVIIFIVFFSEITGFVEYHYFDKSELYAYDEEEYDSEEYSEYEAYEEYDEGEYNEYTIKENWEWDGGPNKVPEEVLTDFYCALFNNGINNEYDDTEYERVEICGESSYQFLQGIFGIALYSGLKTTVRDFNVVLGVSPSEEELEFWDISYAEKFIGLSVFDKEKEKAVLNENGTTFNCYNPEMIKWLYENLIPEPEAIIDGFSYQFLYDKLGSRYFRLMMESYLYLKREGLDKEVRHFKDAMKTNGFDGSYYLNEKYSNILSDYILEEHSYTYLLPERAIGYWLRRLVGGSAYEFYQGHAKVIGLYDSEWFENKLKEYGFEGQKLRMWPAAEVGQLNHIRVQYPINTLEELNVDLSKDTFDDSDYNLKTDDIIAYNSLQYLTNLFNWDDFECIKDYDFEVEPQKAYIERRYSAGDYDIFTFGYEYDYTKCLFGLVFYNDMILDKPVLLKMTIQEEEEVFNYISTVEIDKHKLIIESKAKCGFFNSKNSWDNKTDRYKDVITLKDKGFKDRKEFF